MEQVVELLTEVSCLRLVDERLGGHDQGAGAGEVDPVERPQTSLVEVDELIEGVVAAAMRIAGAGGEVLSLRNAVRLARVPRTAITSGSEAERRIRWVSFWRHY